MPLFTWLHSALHRRSDSRRKKTPSRYRDAFQADLFVSRLEERRVLSHPAGADATLNVPEDETLTFQEADFGFTDPVDAFQAVKISSLPSDGTLKLDGVAVTQDQFISVIDINDNKLTFDPVADANGAPYTTFTFQVEDSTNELDPSANTITINVTPVNDAPVLADTVVTLNAVDEDAGAPSGAVGTLVSSIVGFVGDGGQENVTDVDAASETGIAIIAADATNGTWWYTIDGGTNWLALGAVANDSARVLSADADTRIYFQPNADFNGAVDPAITFRAWDQKDGSMNGDAGVDTTTNGGTTAFSTATDTASLSVTAVNDAPELAAIEGAALDYTENDGAVVVTSTITVADVDDTNIESATIQITGNYQNGQDVLAFADTANITGSWDAGTGTLTLTGSDTLANYQAALRSVTYENTSDAPSTLTRTVSFTVNDGDDPSNTVTRDITVAPLNDAPVLDNSGTMTLTTITEDDTNNGGDLVSDIIASAGGDRITDVDSGALEGIAITATAVNTGSGTWQFSTDNGGSWADVGAVADNSALLLRAVDLVRFVPDGMNAATGTITFRAWDQTSGTEGTKVDASTNGGTTAFSTATETAGITVTAVNDAPVLDNSGTMTLTTITEGDTNNGGDLVSAIIASAGGDRITDVDSGALEGIAITATAVNTGSGTWQFSTDNGGSWADIGVVSDGSALLLRSVDLVRFVPDGMNAATGTITFRAWDQTSGTEGTKVDASTNGGTTAFSTATEAAGITVTAVNDAPVVTPPAMALNATEQTNLDIHGAGFSVSDVDEAGGGATATLTVTAGTITVVAGDSGVTVDSGDGTSTVVISGTIAQINNLLTDGGTGTIIYLNSSDDPPASVTFTVTVNDQGNTGADPGLSGDGTSEEGTANVTINIAAINDPPAIGTNLPLSVNEGATATITTAFLNENDPDDSGTGLTYTVTSGPTNGILQLSTNPGVPITSFTQDDLDNNRVQYVHNGSETTSDSFGFTLADGGEDGATPAAGTFSITVTPVNDAPVVTAPAMALSVQEGANLAIHGKGFSVTDADEAGAGATATLTVTEGNITVVVGDSGVMIGGGNGSGSVTITGTVAQINNLLTGMSSGTITYVNNKKKPADSVTFTVTVNDLGNTGLDPGLTGTGTSEQGSNNVTINIVEVNNAPVVTAPGANLSATEQTNLAIEGAGFSVTDDDAGSGTVTATLSVGEGILTVDVGNTGVTIMSGNSTGTVVLTGTISEINRLLTDTMGSSGTITYFNGSNTPSASTVLTVTVNDQGNTGIDAGLTGDAMSEEGMASITIDIEAVNDAPVVTAPGAPLAASEQTDFAIHGTGFAVTDADEAGGGATATLSVTQGIITVVAGDSGVTMISNNGTGTVTFNGTIAQINALLTGMSTGTITYNNPSDTPAASVTFTVTVNDLGNTGTDPGLSGDGSSEQGMANVTINITAVNDEPTLTSTGQNPTFTEGDPAATLYTGTAVDTIEAGQELDRIVLTVTNITDTGFEFLQVNGVNVNITVDASNVAAGMIGGDAITVDVSIAGTTATVTIKNDAGLSEAQTAALVDGLKYENMSQDPTVGMRVVTLTQLRDTGAGTPPDDNLNDTLAVTSTVTVAAVNDEPTLTATGQDPTFTEGAVPAALYSGTTVDTVEAGQELDRLVLTVTNVIDSGFEFLRINGVNVDLTANALNVAAGTIGGDAITVDVSLAGTTATVTIKNDSGLSEAETATLVNGLAYENTSQDPTAGMRVVTLTQLRDTGPATAPDDNLNDALAVASTVTVVPVNDPPTLVATPLDPTHTEDTPAESLFSNTVIDLVEAADNVQSLTVTVANLQNGSDEKLVVDGVDVELTDGTMVTTAANNFNVSVTVAGGTATVTITRGSTITIADAQALVNGLQYRNDSQDPLGNRDHTGPMMLPLLSDQRTVTLTAIQDDGGTANGGNDTGTPNVASTVTITPVNDAPTVSAVEVTITEDDLPAFVFSFNADDVDNHPSTLIFPAAVVPVVTLEPQLVPFMAAFVANYANLGGGQFQIPTPGDGFQHLAAGEVAMIMFTYSATDTGGLSSGNATVEINVNGLNDAPQIEILQAPASVNEASSGHFEGRVVDVDFSDASTLTLHVNWNDVDNAQEDVAVDPNTGQFSVDHVFADDFPGNMSDVAMVEFIAADDHEGTATFNHPVTVLNLPPQFLQLVASDLDANGTTTVTFRVADPSLRDTPLTVVINWNDPFAEEQDKITVVAVDWVNDNGVFSRSHTYASAPDPGDPTNIRITVSAADDDGGNTVAERMPTIPGTGLASIPFDVTPETPQFIFELPTVVSSPLTIESTVEVIQTTDFRTGQAGPSQGSNEQLILKSLNPDGSENPEEISIGRENERPEDVLRRLPEIFKQLTDGEYRIYLKREDGTRRLVLNVILRRHKQIDPSELKKSGPPAVAEQKDGPDKKDAAPKASKTDAGPKLNAPEQGKATDKPVVAPKPNNRVSDPSTGDTRPAGAIPVRSTAATIPAGDSRNAAAVTAVAAWAGAEGIRRWRQQVDEEMTRWSNAGFMERKRRLSRTRRTLN